MARRGSFLLITWDGGGNVPPMLGIARELAARGHGVRVVGPEGMRRRVVESGAEFCPFTLTRPIDESGPIEGHIEDFFELWVGAASGRELLAELEREPADALVVDCMLLGAFAGAERAGLPTAALVHFLYAPTAFGPWGHGWDGFRERVNAARESLGVGALADDGATLLDQAWRGCARVLVVTAQAFDAPLDELPSNVRYVGPVGFDPPGAGAAWRSPWDADDARPLVCVSLSTTNQNQEELLQRIIDAVGDVEALVLVTYGGGIDGASLRLPANAVAREFVPHSAVLPHAALVVTHAGHGTAIHSLARGVPLVCLPIGRDQHLVAERVAAAGVGIVLAAEASVEEIRHGVLEVLGQPAYRERAREMAGLIGGTDAGRAADELESLLAGE